METLTQTIFAIYIRSHRRKTNKYFA